ncbi:hypothetical protein ABH892_003371 [Paenibacillus sp. RC254]|uniref:hypothetical protein n=1 Tax=unclassified Paenibacillus TaxID=185978 RepID=UPI0024BA58D7|nr:MULTISPECIES: hypothetical protein [unclassified Paenibacillus]
MSKDEDAELTSKAKATAVQYLKEAYGIDVEITYEHKLPKYVAYSINFKGNVKGQKEQTFDISVNYKTQETSDFIISPELEKVLLEKGYELS